MGWTFYTNPHDGPQNAAEVKEEIRRMMTSDNHEVVDICNSGNTYYAAVRFTGNPNSDRYVTDADGSYVFAAIFLTKRDRGCWGYKDMDECMGPNEAKCPKRILAMLSPLQDHSGNDYARDWRKRCAEQKAPPKVKAGQHVTLAAAMPFADGVTRQRFEAVEVPGRSRWVKDGNRQTLKATKKIVFKCLDTGALCRLSGADKAAAHISEGV